MNSMVVLPTIKAIVFRIVHQTPVMILLLLNFAAQPVREEDTIILDLSVQCLIRCIVNAMVLIICQPTWGWNMRIVNNMLDIWVISIVPDLQ